MTEEKHGTGSRSFLSPLLAERCGALAFADGCTPGRSAG